ncbi:spore germination protein GerPB [Paenibacillus alginolyticus]|uniref:Spore germination protein GerPB n=1 Tax=Paenibacillus alginolyticus TaxID=59839 RepID=A0ABT4G7G2_9BACL|nr:spore germination protein GerPB [Paenibacillus alginolyticus]MCY9692112.1 spore germination protein GerPB [Paenibacillus alginolyticus]MEC0147878.1 spore germination protein GerPB [Paenibacillus alginolyticus]
MNWTIHQTIMIQHLRVDSVANSSVLQIGTAGSVRSLSNLYNTGGFVESAPALGASPTNPVSLVPLPPPT